jgi:hypothetical protein
VAADLLITLSLLKIVRFLAGDLRLRTACNLALAGPVRVSSPEGFALPSEADLVAEAKRLIGECKPLFADPPVHALSVAVALAKQEQKSTESNKDAETPTDDDN